MVVLKFWCLNTDCPCVYCWIITIKWKIVHDPSNCNSPPPQKHYIYDNYDSSKLFKILDYAWLLVTCTSSSSVFALHLPYTHTHIHTRTHTRIHTHIYIWKVMSVTTPVIIFLYRLPSFWSFSLKKDDIHQITYYDDYSVDVFGANIFGSTKGESCIRASKRM